MPPFYGVFCLFFLGIVGSIAVFVFELYAIINNFDILGRNFILITKYRMSEKNGN
jgi:hypothetical protein